MNLGEAIREMEVEPLQFPQPTIPDSVPEEVEVPDAYPHGAVSVADAQLAIWEAEAQQAANGEWGIVPEMLGYGPVILALIAEVRRLRSIMAVPAFETVQAAASESCQQDGRCRFRSIVAQMCPPCQARHERAMQASMGTLPSPAAPRPAPVEVPRESDRDTGVYSRRDF